MTPAVVSWGPNSLALGLLAGYALAGFAVAALLSRRGTPSGTALSALAVWPLLLPLLGEAPAQGPRPGPLSARIDSVFAALAQVLRQTGTTELSDGDLERLRDALHRADERLALVDGLLAQPAEDGSRSWGRLEQARRHAASEIEAVLAELAELRLQIGLLTLSGGGSVRAQLEALQSRVAALEEVEATT